jgi:hypothetical protein
MNGFGQFRLVKNEINWLGDLDSSEDSRRRSKTVGLQRFLFQPRRSCRRTVDHVCGPTQGTPVPHGPLARLAGLIRPLELISMIIRNRAAPFANRTRISINFCASGLSRLWPPVGGTEIAAGSSVTTSMYCSCRRRSFINEASQHSGGRS